MQSNFSQGQEPPVSSQPIKMGVIGVGNMGRHHTCILSQFKDIELVGISDVNVERGLSLAGQYRTRFFENYLELLPHLDAVCIAVPTKLHHQVGLDCLQAGVHVLLEKPIAASIAEAESLVNAAANAKRILQVGHIERFNPAFVELIKVARSEEILAVEARRMSPYSQRANDVSVALDLMIHDIDLLLELTGSPVIKLTASGSSAADSGYLDYITATLSFANGIVATLTASKITHSKIRSLTAHCKKSFINTDLLNSDIAIHRYPVTTTSKSNKLYRQDGIIEKIYTSNVEPLYAQLEHFVGCIRGGEHPSVGGEQGIQALRLASLIEQIALDGKVWQYSDPQRPTESPSVSVS